LIALSTTSTGTGERVNQTSQPTSPTTYLALFLISIAILASEILMMRIVSLIFLIFIVYAVIGITMLGFAAAGTFLAVVPAFLQKSQERRLAFLSFAFALTTPVVYYVSVVPAPFALGLKKFLLYVLLISLVMTVHFFLAGLVISYLFTRRVWEVNRLYSINLVGSGIGCFLVVQFIRPLGGEGLILVVTFLAALAAAFFAAGHAKKLTVLSLVYAFCALCLIPFSSNLFPIHPTLYGKQMPTIMFHHPETKIEYQAWDPVARVDVFSIEDEYVYLPEKLPFKFATNDGSNGTMMLGIDKEFNKVDFADQTWLGLPYWLKKNPEVLVIGLGGSMDIMAALHYQAKKIRGVEISERMIEIVRDEFRSFTHSPYQHDSVEIIHDEGRSYVRRMEEDVDLIQMSGVDTLAAQFGGSFVMVENFLYTVEAFKEYFNHLRPDGILCITRFLRNPEYPERGMRTCAIGVEALRQLGVEHPENNFVVIGYGFILTTMMKKTPFTEEEIRTIEENLERYKPDPTVDPAPFVASYVDLRYQEGRKILYKPGHKSDHQYVKYFTALKEGREADFIANYPYDMSVCTDNKPFFFVSERWDNLFRKDSRPGSASPFGFILQALQLAWFCLLTLALVLLPLYLFRRKGLQTKGSKTCIVYFSCLGLGFMLIEIGFMQKFALFLGHPTYSITVVLFSLLVFAGLGSLASGMTQWSHRNLILASILSVVAIAALYLWILDPIFHRFLTMPLGIRMLIAILLVSPLAFFMGIPFPIGLRVLENQAMELVPWAWAINGSASVIATTAAALIAVLFGFSVVVVCAIIIYLAGMLFMVSPGLGLATK
jgi:spermidine synthase